MSSDRVVHISWTQVIGKDPEFPILGLSPHFNYHYQCHGLAFHRLLVRKQECRQPSQQWQEVRLLLRLIATKTTGVFSKPVRNGHAGGAPCRWSLVRLRRREAGLAPQCSAVRTNRRTLRLTRRELPPRQTYLSLGGSRGQAIVVG